LNFFAALLSVAIASICLVRATATAQTNIAPDAAPTAGKPSPSAPPLAFDVVSIRPGKPGSTTWMIGSVDDEFRAIGLPLGITILRAYLPMIAHRDQLSGAPSWVWNDTYDFVAKVSAADLPEWQNLRKHGSPLVSNKMLQTMLQAALEERCKLVVHRIPGEVSGYALVIGKHGPNWKKLKEANPDETIPPDAQKIALEGRMVPIMPGAEPALTYYMTSMASLAADLTTLQGIPVEDRTGVPGKYDFSLTRWKSDDGSYSWDLEALGLKLQPINVPTDTLVIDHIERPSPN
jgi:uncharacterized protein (TIGR03435 family)